MTADILTNIHNKLATFSKGQRRIATYILESYDKAAFLTAGALGGLYLMALLGLALLCAACAMRSVGSPLTAPLTPRRPGNPDLLIRFPLWRQKARAFFAGRKN